MTNNNSPLTGQPSRNLAKALVALLVILTCTCLVFGGWVWSNERQQCLAVERNEAVMARLREISETHFLLCRISAGKTDELMRTLDLKLSKDIRDLCPLLISTDDKTRDFTRVVCEAVFRARMKRSGYYSTNTASIGSGVAGPGEIGQTGRIIRPPGVAQNN